MLLARLHLPVACPRWADYFFFLYRFQIYFFVRVLRSLRGGYDVPVTSVAGTRNERLLCFPSSVLATSPPLPGF